jgi:tetratricopeptide (TPR) repeat protein
MARNAEAEHYDPLALEIYQSALGPRDPKIANVLTNLGVLAQRRGEHKMAARHYREALEIWRTNGLESSLPASVTLHNLASAERLLGNRPEARKIIERALAGWRAALGPGHPTIAEGLATLALLQQDDRDYTQAEATLQRALDISRDSLGAGHPVVASILNQYAELLKKMKRKDEARKIKEQALEAARVHVRDNPNYQMVDVSSLVSR